MAISIYRFFGSTIVGRAATITKSKQDDKLLWYKWLGHIGECGMRELQKRNLLAWVKSCKLDFWKYYLIGKQCKVQFETSTHYTKGIMDYFHSNILGSAKVISKYGY